jgi:hypothetical protein
MFRYLLALMLTVIIGTSLLFRHVLRRATPSGICSRVYSRHVT